MKRIHLSKVKLSNGETIGYREREGGQDPLLLLHGNMTSSKHWDVLIEALNKRYKVIAPDLRGFGESTYHRPIVSLKDFSDDVRDFVERLGIPRFSVMGWSTGGGVAMQLAADYPDDVRKLVLLASASTRGYPFYPLDSSGEPMMDKRCRTKEEIAFDRGKTQPVTQAYAQRDKAFLRRLWNHMIYTQKQPDEHKYDAYLEDMLTQRNLVDVYHALNIFNISERENELGKGTGEAAKIKAPTLILRGEKDYVVSENMQREILEDLDVKKEFHILKGCGHSPLIDDLPQLRRYVESFIK